MSIYEENRKAVKESLPRDIKQILDDYSLSDVEKVERMNVLMELYDDWTEPGMNDMV